MKIVVACIPAAVLGLLLDDWMDAHLYNGYVVAAALIIYGVLFIVLENHTTSTRIFQSSAPDRFLIGPLFSSACSRCFPWCRVPPVRFYHSWSHDLGCSRSAAAEFSFFLGIPVMFGASLLKAVEVRVPFYRTGAVFI